MFHDYDELMNCNEVLRVCELVVGEFRATLSWNCLPVLSGRTHYLMNDLDLFARSKESGLVCFPNSKSET